VTALPPLLAIKIDVDTARGTAEGVPALVELFRQLGLRATFLFALGPDNTGRAIKRVFRPGFLGKVGRTNVVGRYGLRTLGNGVLWPGPRIDKRHGDVMRAAEAAGHECGIHCWDHIRWQDGLATMSPAEVEAELGKARASFERVFGRPARTAGAAGWQADANSLAAYDKAGFDYASDARGPRPFLPRWGGRVFRTLQMPTTLPTLDELLGRPEYPEDRLIDHYLGLLRPGAYNGFTGHAEIEGMSDLPWFRRFLEAAAGAGARFVLLADQARAVLERPDAIPVDDLVAAPIDGRSGTVALQIPSNDATHDPTMNDRGPPAAAAGGTP
jgi:peptidoglycan/xylan/chitin deacetylase (PgdA/CDA1 family)